MDENMKAVRFDRYCKLCENKDLDEKYDPCNECLEYGMREGTAKPMYYKPKT